MTTRITTCARSPLGRLLALAVISLMLLFVGLQLFNDASAGGVNSSIQAFLKSISTPTMQAREHDALQAISDHFKKYDQVELIAYYGIAIVAGFAFHGWFGWLIRAYRFQFLPTQGVIERPALWLYMPVWLWVWMVLALLIPWIVGTRTSVVLFHLSIPLWLILAILIPGVVAIAGWKFLPRVARRVVCVPGMRRHQRFERIKRMELLNAADGGTSLVVTFQGESSWTVCRGSVKRLQRTGGALARVIGLRRQDLATWGGGARDKR